MTNKISSEQKSEYLKFIRENFGKISQREIALRLNLGKTTVNRWSAEIGLKHRKHTVNEDFFDTLNEASAYVLGFIYADGNVVFDHKRGHYALTITSAAKDKNHLEKIRKLISSTKPLLYSHQTNSYRLIVHNKNLCRKLIFLGVIPKKSLVVEFPNLPQKHIRHFIRGVIDGDGNVRYVERKRSPYFEITIASGSSSFCEGLINCVKSHINVDSNIRKVGRNTNIVQYSCTRGKKLADFIYSNANIYLKRKYKPYRVKVLKIKND